MIKKRLHRELHRSQRSGWIRATVLGANDGIVSTACLLLGVAAAQSTTDSIVVAGLAGLIAGALSMAVGEWVSVASQRDVEDADIRTEERELATMPARELDELAQIYAAKGLSAELARQVAVELTAKDPLAAHLIEELGITPNTRARPLQAAASSAAAFTVGAALPLVAMVIAPIDARIAITGVVSVCALGGLGAVAAKLGGAPVTRAVIRVVVSGIAAMAITLGIGALVGANLA